MLIIKNVHLIIPFMKKKLLTCGLTRLIELYPYQNHKFRYWPYDSFCNCVT